MLSSNWHVMLQLTVFKIFTIKWPKFRPRISNFGDRWGYCKRGEDMSGVDMYHHAKFYDNQLHHQFMSPYTKSHNTIYPFIFRMAGNCFWGYFAFLYGVLELSIAWRYYIQLQCDMLYARFMHQVIYIHCYVVSSTMHCNYLSSVLLSFFTV